MIANQRHPTPTRATFHASAIALMLTLVGCALPLPDKPVRPQPYDLGPAPATTGSVAQGTALALDSVEAPALIDGTSVLYRQLYSGGGQQPRPYAAARWVMTPPQLITQRLREALAATRPVLDGSLGLAPLRLRVELEEFMQVFSAPGVSEGVVRLRVTAITPSAQAERLGGQRTFVVRRPSISADAEGGVIALREATDEAVRQIVAWVGTLPGAAR